MDTPNPKSALHNKLNVGRTLQILKPGGSLSQTLKGFEARAGQLEMTTDVINAYNNDQIALIEAGTGTGKSLAYLIPALIWAACFQERTVISTNTITLQEQLINKDIPLLIKALNLHLKIALVKGMNNYICLRKIEDAQIELRLFPSEEAIEIEKIASWSASANDGSRTELPFSPSAAAWEKVGAESDACSHNDCPHYQKCFFFKARKQAIDAQIIIVNHHLLFSDLQRRAVTKNYDSQAILPAYQRIILDEAHHIEDVATEYFASRANRLELLRLLSRLTAEKQNKAYGKLPFLKEKIQLIYNKSPPSELTPIFTSLTIDLPAIRRRLLDQTHETFEAFGSLGLQLANGTQSIEEAAEGPSDFKVRLLPKHQVSSDWSDKVLQPSKILLETIESYVQEIKGLESKLKLINNEKFQEQTKGLRYDIQAFGLRFEAFGDIIKEFISPLTDTNKVRWIESQKAKIHTNIHLVDAHLDISKRLANDLFNKFKTIILCSATLTSNKCFSFIRHRLGITDALLNKRKVVESIYESPFNYQKQALLVIPKDIPHPSHPEFINEAVEKIWEAIQASRGNAFVLFTSYSMLKICYELLISRLQKNKYSAFKQGDDHRHILLAKFKNTNYSVLFGTDSFWEGIDVVGDALRCVIIVKLPFRVPSDPMVQARTEAILAAGKDPFFDYSVPNAIVKFKQGFGRLIRNKQDRGCIVCLDTRLINKGYGKLFLNSLPNCAQLFCDGSSMHDEMQKFYRRTYYLAKENS